MTAQGRAAQRAWLLEHFPADLSLLVPERGVPYTVRPDAVSNAKLLPCCRCYRCGKLLASTAIWPDKVDPNGTTRRNNLRPACSEHVGITPPRSMTDAQVAEATRRHRRAEVTA